MTPARIAAKLRFVPAFLTLLCAGCARAPSVDIIGSFFPVWMICLTAGLVLTFVVRALLLRLRVESEVGPLALFYPSAIVLFACVLWLIFYS